MVRFRRALQMKAIDRLKTPRLLPWHWRRPITTQEAWRSCYAFPKVQILKTRMSRIDFRQPHC